MGWDGYSGPCTARLQPIDPKEPKDRPAGAAMCQPGRRALSTDRGALQPAHRRVASTHVGEPTEVMTEGDHAGDLQPNRVEFAWACTIHLPQTTPGRPPPWPRKEAGTREMASAD